MGQVRSKKYFPEITILKIFETNSSFRLKQENFIICFSGEFASIKKVFILAGRLGTRVSY